MNAKEARRMLAKEYRKQVKDEEKIIELLRIIAEEEHDGESYASIGGIYYGNRKYDLALKYYELALEYGDKTIHSGLGYIWYYGRTGIRDYEKAFYHFSKAAELFVYDACGNVLIDRSFSAIEARSKMADMYKNGYYVEKNYEEYKRIIRELYELTKYYNFPEIFTRMASVLEEEGNLTDATELRWISVQCLADRLKYNQFFGEFNRMNWCINDIYRMNEFVEEDMQFYDLFYVLKTKCIVMFRFDDEIHKVYSEAGDDGMAVNFDGRWFRSIDDFMQKGRINEIPLAVIAEDMYDWEIVNE